MQIPSPAHLTEAHRVIADLYATRHLAIEYSRTTPYQDINALRVASDASFADDKATRCSTQRYLIKLFNGPTVLCGNPLNKKPSVRQQQKQNYSR